MKLKPSTFGSVNFGLWTMLTATCHHPRAAILHVRPGPDRKASLDERLAPVLTAVCEEFCLKRSLLLSSNRPEYIVVPRMVVIWIAYHHLGLEPNMIADYFDKHRATIRHALQTIADRIETDQPFRGRIERLQNKLGFPSLVNQGGLLRPARKPDLNLQPSTLNGEANR